MADGEFHVVDSDGSFGLLADGSFGVANASGDCEECCDCFKDSTKCVCDGGTDESPVIACEECPAGTTVYRQYNGVCYEFDCDAADSASSTPVATGANWNDCDDCCEGCDECSHCEGCSTEPDCPGGGCCTPERVQLTLTGFDGTTPTCGCTTTVDMSGCPTDDCKEQFATYDVGLDGVYCLTQDATLTCQYDITGVGSWSTEEFDSDCSTSICTDSGTFDLRATIRSGDWRHLIQNNSTTSCTSAPQGGFRTGTRTECHTFGDADWSDAICGAKTACGGEGFCSGTASLEACAC